MQGMSGNLGSTSPYHLSEGQGKGKGREEREGGEGEGRDGGEKERGAHYLIIIKIIYNFKNDFEEEEQRKG